MKKSLCILLSIVMILSVSVHSNAANENGTDTPIIIIPGFLQTALHLEKEDGSEERIWLPDMLKAIPTVGKSLPEIMLSVPGLFAGNTKALSGSLINIVCSLLSKMECNPDGTSKFPLVPYENNPAKRNLKAIKAEDDIHMQAYYTFASYICEKNYSSEDNVFVFEYDGRMDIVTISAELKSFIQSVKEYTQNDKVRLFGISYGGQIAEAYLHFYLEDGDVDKAILNVPSLGGTSFAGNFLNQKVELALDDIIDIAESAMKSDTAFNRLLKDVEPDTINRILNDVAAVFAEYAKHWGSIYSLATTEDYEALKEKYLDSSESAEIIRRNDIVHYEITPNIKATLEKCLEKGIDVAIHAGSGIDLAMGGNENSDLLLATTDVTGAETAVMGKRFKDGYTGKKTSCSNPDHYHISPSMEIDASTAYLPEHTWFTDGTNHASFQSEDYCIELAAKALCTDELKDIYSSPEFPQFMCSKNPHRGVFASFDKSASGFITEDDTKLIVENLYEKNIVQILFVKAEGMDIKFFTQKPVVLLPGQTAEFTVKGSFPEEATKLTAVTVKYLKLDTISTTGERKLDFTFRRGVETSADGETTENEFYADNSSGMPLFKKIIYAVIYIFDLFFVLKDFLLSDMVKFVL